MITGAAGELTACVAFGAAPTAPVACTRTTVQITTPIAYADGRAAADTTAIVIESRAP